MRRIRLTRERFTRWRAERHEEVEAPSSAERHEEEEAPCSSNSATANLAPIESEYDKLGRLDARLGRGFLRTQVKAYGKGRAEARARKREIETRASEARLRAAQPDYTADPLVYHPLSHPKSQIRLLEVDAAKNGDVYCTLSDHDLSEAPSFIAMSYTWGSPLEWATIYINTKPHRVRLNCRSALHRIAEAKVKGWIWMDAVCINQNDNIEKASQVQMMTTIFSRASWVAVIPEQPPSMDQHSRVDIRRLLRDDHQDMKQLLRDPFFTRIWTVQEVLVAKEARVIVNRNHVDDANDPPCASVNLEPEFEDDYYEHSQRNCSFLLLDLESSLEAAAAGQNPGPEGLDRVRRLVRDLSTEQKRPQGSATALRPLNVSSIFRYLNKYDDLCCEDPRDRIYALLPMALRDTNAPELAPNYETSLLGVLLEFVSYVFAVSNRECRTRDSLFSDLLVCLMKLISSFGLDLSHPDIHHFFGERFCGPSLVAVADHAEIASMLTNGSNHHAFHEFGGMCVGQKGDGQHRTQLCNIANLAPDVQCRIYNMHDHETSQSEAVMPLMAICYDDSPVLLTTNHIQPGDIVLTPLAGPMAWTWNLVFRETTGGYDRFDLVAHAVVLKGSNPARLIRRPCCQDESCPARASSKQVYLHSEDVVAMALLSRHALQRLKDPATTPACGSYAILTGHNPRSIRDVAKVDAGEAH